MNINSRAAINEYAGLGTQSVPGKNPKNLIALETMRGFFIARVVRSVTLYTGVILGKCVLIDRAFPSMDLQVNYHLKGRITSRVH